MALLCAASDAVAVCLHAEGVWYRRAMICTYRSSIETKSADTDSLPHWGEAMWHTEIHIEGLTLGSRVALRRGDAHDAGTNIQIRRGWS